MQSRQIRTAMGLLMVMVIIAATAIGCFVASASWGRNVNDDGAGTPVDWRAEASLNGGLQRFGSYQELKDFLKTAPTYPGYWGWNGGRAEMMLDDTAALSLGEGAQDYSKTNIQVEGVDEADIVKSDGEYIYLATDNRLIIARAYPASRARVVCETEVEGIIEGLFINGDRLVVVEGGGSVYGAWREWSSSYDYGVKTSVIIYDVTDRENPVVKREISVDGYYVSSRVIGDHVYLVASGSTWASEDNVTLPSVYDGRETVEIQAADIWHSATPDHGYSFTTIMSVNIIDDGEQPEHETLLIGSASTVYVSPSNIYVTFPDWSGQSGKTSIHRIHIREGQIEYHATGEVPGSLLNQFSMDEHGEYFRVATTVWDWSASTSGMNRSSSVYVLDQSLDIYGRLENLAPGEQIYSARFTGSRSYLVTFKTVDPLFVIDLANPGNPKVLGELKIPGYSDYLHPYDENHVIGIGKDVDETIDADKIHADDAVYYTAVKGVKISLFDVTDVSNPREIAKYVIGDRGTETPVTYDHKALLFDRSKNLLVLPVSVVEISLSDQTRDSLWGSAVGYWQGAYVFNISVERGMELRGKISHCDSEEYGKDTQVRYYGYSSCSIERSLYIGDVLYTISDQKIGMNDLETLKEVGEISLPVKAQNEVGGTEPGFSIED